MYKVQFILLLVIAIIGSIRTFIIPAGKCRPDVMPISIDIDRIAKLHRWKILYGSEVYKGIDREYRESFITGQDKYKLIDTRTLTNGSTDTYAFPLETIERVLHENTLDENGNTKRFKIILLALTSEDALLYYRCSDSGREDIDTRIIEIPRERTLSDFGLKELLAIDKLYGFQGDLIKLPYSVKE